MPATKTRRSGVLRWILIGGATACVAALVATTVFFKPVRVLFPDRFGLICLSQTLCIEDVARQAEAETLIADAKIFVSQKLGPLQVPPHVLLCSSRACFAQFGNPEVAALYFWGAGVVVVNDIGWEPHILRHELIHHWQAENLGDLRAALSLPAWYIEGMAYVLSEDPRAQIPHPTPQAQRQRFRDWIAAGNDWRHPPDGTP